ncbi:MAG: hypothetical protein V1874_17425 [Spirochaetota bacterium]
MIHLISDKLVEFVEKNSDVILKEWLNRVCKNKVSTFTDENIDFVRNKAEFILRNLKDWISYDKSKDEIGERYANEGKDFFNKGVPLCEVFRTTVLLRRVLWLFVVNESGFDSAYELHQMRELNDRVILFFDRSHYYLTRGYMEAMNDKMKKLWKLTDDETEKVFFHNSFYNK